MRLKDRLQALSAQNALSRWHASQRHADFQSTAGAGPAVHFGFAICPSEHGIDPRFASRRLHRSERSIRAKRHIAAWVVQEVIACEATRRRGLELAELDAHKSTAAACIVFLVAEHTALKP